MALDLDAFNNERNEIEIEVVTLSGAEKKKTLEGTTVADFKRANGLVGTTIIDEDSEVLRDDDVLEESMQVFISTPKKNG